MNSTITHAPQSGLKRARDSLGVLFLVVAVSATFVGLERLVRGPGFVDRIVVHNPTDQLIDVHVTGHDRNGWLDIAIVEPHRTTNTRDVIDQGDTWIFEFRSPGYKGGELEMSRAELEQSRWRIEIPADVATRSQPNR